MVLPLRLLPLLRNISRDQIHFEKLIERPWLPCCAAAAAAAVLVEVEWNQPPWLLYCKAVAAVGFVVEGE